jgi:chromosome segregation ATPase
VRLEAEEADDIAHKTETDIHEQQKHCEGLSQSLRELTQELAHVSREGESLSTRKREMEETLRTINSESETMVSSIKDMQHQIEQHKLKQQTLQAKMDASLKEIEQGTTVLQALERETDRTMAALDAMRMARRSAEHTRDRAEKELQEEEKLKAAAESSVAKTHTDIAAMRREYDNRQADLARLQEELERDKKLVEGGEDKWREGDVARREVAVQRAMLDQAANRARTELESMQSSYQKTKGELDATLEEIRRLTADSKKAEQEIQAAISEKNLVSFFALILNFLVCFLYIYKIHFIFDVLRSNLTLHLYPTSEQQ